MHHESNRDSLIRNSLTSLGLTNGNKFFNDEFFIRNDVNKQTTIRPNYAVLKSDHETNASLIQVELPGYAREDIQVSMVEGVLFVEVTEEAFKRKTAQIDHHEGIQFFKTEDKQSVEQRPKIRFNLSKADKTITPTLENGVLKILVQYSEPKQSYVKKFDIL